ncbi:Holliday junction DNA helicase RuvA [Rhodomicrobium vannielii ATCC 17100]|jgi:Holliday junction DNA helicase RuvA|uniref:Holliday junction branch migration complex subunit RuvA n=2 Tax=Rhodomicrobium TaxID=1068 RepID=E3I2E9_RHOVT|nr:MULTISPECIES: Holliday junction branch migration protein RuvA [Rhodomicrobium]ADP70233.1 Holliday junction DNA helicase RuvA [Rhodomicrobium vannielii ATCC 17100]KAI95442.1 ATP-dependent DNA helicase RuvA [Rhodomicrobium udaipurense JA643]MBJ7533855.1 Holliday junction branch migration protein RuvA [Rhodomicrobium vannielii ATCC 17100]MBJ7543484.1 Holliday junction branch migration protein RuvA [Rhodomicrobium udaipurense]
MIGKLKGIVDAVGADHAIIDVGGVGYEVACSPRTLGALKPGEPVALSIETYVREDAIKLYGFLSEAERGWFRLLQSVQGVGAKVALSILATLDSAQLAQAIAMQDRVSVTRAPGVGPKVALRIVNELKDKAPPLAFSVAAIAAPASGSASAAIPASAAPSPAAEAVSALVNLGYAPLQANAAISTALGKAGEDARTEDLIRLGLKDLAR